MMIQLFVAFALVQLVHSGALGDTCTVATVATDCSGITYVECSGSPLVCTCPTGYTDSNGGATAGGTCQGDLGSACTSASECTTTGNGACTSSACVCASGYYDSNGATAGGSCFTALGATCTNDAAGNTLCETTYGIANSECTAGLQCVCKDGYKASGSLTSCVSGAIRIQASILVFVLLAIATLYLLV